MRVLIRVVAVSVAVLVSRYAAAAEPLRPRLVLSFGSEAGHPGESVTIEVASLDGAGAPVDAPVAVDVEAGKVTPLQRVSTGVYRCSVSIPTKLPQSRSLLVLARAGVMSADASLRLAPGVASSIRLDGPALCREDAEACRIDVTAADAYGNPAAEVPDASAELGRVSPAGAAEPGHWVLIYHAPRIDRERTDRVTVQLGGLKAVHAMKLTPASTAFGFTPLLGVVRQEKRFGFSAGGQVATARAVGAGWVMGAGLEGAWWSTSRTATASGLHSTIDRSQLAFGAFVQAERPSAGGALAAFSVGGGAVRVNSTVHVEGQPGVSDSGWAPTARAAIMLGHRTALGTPFVEGRVAWVGDAHLVTDPGAQWPLFLQLGYRLDVR